MPALPDESSTRTPCIHYGTKKVNRRTAAAPASAVSVCLYIVCVYVVRLIVQYMCWNLAKNTNRSLPGYISFFGRGWHMSWTLL